MKLRIIKKCICVSWLLLALLVSGCTNSQKEQEKTTTVIPSVVTTAPVEKEKAENIIDFADAESFEYALNHGSNLEGKIVQFTVCSYHPDSALGYNAWAGEHLNFISDTDLRLSEGQKVFAIANEISKVLGSWVIRYEVVENAVSTDQTCSSEDFSKIDKLYQSKYYFTNNVYVGKKVKIVITDVDVILPGNKFNTFSEKALLRFKYEMTNLSEDTEVTAGNWLYYFKAIQDNNPNTINELSSGIQEDTQYHDTQRAKIKPNGTVVGIWVYELDDLVTPVQLVAYSTDDNIIGEQIYEICDLVTKAENLPTSTDNVLKEENVPTTTSASIEEKTVEETQPITEPKVDETEDNKNKDGIRPEFRKSMEEYEAFFDEYVEFMQQFKKNPSDLSLLTKYMTFLSKYNDAMQAMENIGKEELSPQELALYTEVMLRIESKLLKAVG